MKRYFHSFYIIIIICLVAIFTQSGCRENTLIRSKVLPANDTVGVRSYTLSCVTHTYYDDTAITSTDIGGIPTYQAVGTYYDAFFGTLSGATFFQVSEGVNISNTFASMSVDSAFLILPYGGFTYGDSLNTNLTKTYQVFYMLDTLGSPVTSTYYSYSTKPIDITNPLSDPVTVNLYQLRDSFGYNILNYTYPALHIKLRLPALFKYLNPAMNLLATSTNLPQDFLDAFNGICVTSANTLPQPTTNDALPYFQLDGNNFYMAPNQFNTAGIIVYYHDPTISPVVVDTVQFPFDPSVCSHFNNLVRSYRNYPVNALLHSTLANDSVIVLQNQPGASLDIKIPGITKLPAGIINNAQLQLNILPTDSLPYPYTLVNIADTAALPERLYPIGIGSPTYPVGVGNGVAYNLADRYPTTSLTPLTYMDGFYHYINGNIKTYTINIPREVMASIAAKNDTLHLHINGTQDYYGAFNMVAGGGTYSKQAYQAKFIVVYSKLNN